MNKMQKQVEEFHKLYNVPAPQVPGIPSPERIHLRMRLIMEELAEFSQAAIDGDLIEVADAIGDLLYVVFGTAVEFGINMGPVVDEIHRSNLTKLGADGKPVHREDGKVIKGPNYQPPAITYEMLKLGELQELTGFVSAPTQNELPVYDVVTGVTSSRNAYVASLCAEKIQELSWASETRVCPAIEVIKKVIEEKLGQFFRSTI